MKTYDDIYEAQYAYDEYLENHINGVQRAWYEMLRPQVEKNNLCDQDELYFTDDCVDHHDASKYDVEEYGPYRAHFYPCNVDNAKKDSKKYDLAWLHHQHINPHHWQYWILQKDSGSQEILDMNPCYIFEMICDWHSFTLRDPESTAYKWYQDNKDKMMFSDKTRNLVEKLVEFMKEPLPNEVHI